MLQSKVTSAPRFVPLGTDTVPLFGGIGCPQSTSTKQVNFELYGLVIT